MSALHSDRRRVDGPLDVAPSTIILIDDRTLMRQCLAHWLELGEQHFRIVALPRLDQSEGLQPYGRIDLVVLSIGSASAAEPAVAGTLDWLQEALPEVPRVVMSDLEGISAVIEAIKRGARGYIPTSLEPHVVVEALRFVQTGGTFVPASALIDAAIAPAARAESSNGGGVRMLGLTRRELQVLDHLRQGKPNKAIAHELAMQESTVKMHVRCIMKKLHATNRTQAAFLAQRLGDATDEIDGRLDRPHAHGGGAAVGPGVGK